MAEPVPNLELLRRVLKQIDEHPETWDQQFFGSKTECGTTFCIAGHTALMSGYNPSWDFEDDANAREVSYETTRGFDHDVVASILLGLNEYEADCLFDGSNNRHDIEQAALMIADRAGQPLWPEQEAPCSTES